MMTLQRVVEFVGTFAFALSGIRLAASKHYDWLGGFVCGVAVAIGGGTIRDVMLGDASFLDAESHLSDMYAYGAGCRHRVSPLSEKTR